MELDPIFFMTPNEVLDNIHNYDWTVDIIGYVEEIELENVKNVNEFNFVLNNGNGRRVQIVAWIDFQKKVKNHVKKNNIIYFNGVYAKILKDIKKNKKYYDGCIPHVLHIKEHTVISVLGQYSNFTKRVKLNDNLNILRKESISLSKGQEIELRGFIKVNFVQVKRRMGTYEELQLFGCGSITDGTYNIQILVKNFKDEEYNNRGIQRGDEVKVTGSIYIKDQYSNPPYLLVNEINKIRRLTGHMPLNLLIEGTRILTLEGK